MKRNSKYYIRRCLIGGIIMILLLSGSLWIYSSHVKKNFSSFTKTVFQDAMSGNTLSLHYTLADPAKYGIESYAPTLGDISLNGAKESQQQLKAYQKSLDKISYRFLNDDQKVTYDILNYYFDTELSGSDYILFSEMLGPTIGIQAQLPVLLAEYTFRTKQDIDDYLNLLSQMDTYYKSIIEFETEKSKAGLFMASYTADNIISQCQEFIKDPDNMFLSEIFDEKIGQFPNLEAAEQEQYKEQHRAILKNNVIPAYQLLIDGLTNLKPSGVNEKGLCYLKNGINYYQYLLKSNIGTSRSVTEIAELLDQQMRTDLESMSALAAKNPSLMTTSDEYAFPLTEPKDILEDLKKKIKKDFPTAPDVTCDVKYVHDSLAEHLSPAFYLTPPLDNLKDNVIYINPASNDTKLNLYTTLAHEGYPGHLYQTIFSNSALTDPLRSAMNFGGYSEGWATYVEMYSYQLADMDHDLAELLRLNTSLTLCLYSNMDIGIHYSGWTTEQTAAYLKNFGITDTATANAIYEAIIEAPTNYLKYYLGYLEFLSLKEKAEKKEDFNLKEFHTWLLETGPAPFSVLEEYIKN